MVGSFKHFFSADRFEQLLQFVCSISLLVILLASFLRSEGNNCVCYQASTSPVDFERIFL